METEKQFLNGNKAAQKHQKKALPVTTPAGHPINLNQEPELIA